MYQLNYTLIKEELSLTGKPEYQFSTPRVSDLNERAVYPPSCFGYTHDANASTNIDASFIGPDIASGDPLEVQTQKNLTRQACMTGSSCLTKLCSEIVSISYWAIDSVREKELDIGRSWKYATLEENEVYISDSLANLWNQTVGF